MLDACLGKLDLTQQQKSRMLKEEQHKVKEEPHTEKEEDCKARERCFNDWECIQLYIRLLSIAFGYESNVILKHDMQSDIIVLLNRKNLPAKMLNFT